MDALRAADPRHRVAPYLAARTPWPTTPGGDPIRARAQSRRHDAAQRSGNPGAKKAGESINLTHTVDTEGTKNSGNSMLHLRVLRVLRGDLEFPISKPPHLTAQSSQSAPFPRRSKKSSRRQGLLSCAARWWYR